MRLLSLFAGVGLIALAGCVPAPSTPPPAPVPRPVPAPAPPPPPKPKPTIGADWRDWPLTPGDWHYRAGAATYGVAGGAPLAILRCDLVSRRVTLSRTGSAPATLTLRTTSAVRAVPAAPDSGTPGMLAMSFAATDNFLDALGFSRGRFLIEGGGLPVLVIPAWPEILRVVEDCRR